jgi:hypothetical protein
MCSYIPYVVYKSYMFLCSLYGLNLSCTINPPKTKKRSTYAHAYNV